MGAGWNGGHGEALEQVGVRVGVRGAVGGQVAGVAGFLLCGAGAVVAALRVGHDLRGAGGLGGGGGWWEGLRAGRVPYRLWWTAEVAGRQNETWGVSVEIFSCGN